MLGLTAVAPAAGVFAQSFLVLPTEVLAILLSWFSGMFLYLGAHRLLPEARRASASVLVPVLSLSGVALAYVAHAVAP